MVAGDDESGPIDASVRRILSAEPATFGPKNYALLFPLTRLVDPMVPVVGVSRVWVRTGLSSSLCIRSSLKTHGRGEYD